MPHISDSRFEALRAQLPSEPPTTNDLLFAWTLTQGGSGNTLNDRIYSMLISQGATPGHVNDMWAQVLVLQGFSGSLNDQLKQFWEAGGSFSGSTLDNYLLDATNLDEYLLDDTNPDDVYLLEDAPDPDIDAYTLTVAAGSFTISGNNHLTPYFNGPGTRVYFARLTSWETWQYSLSTPGDLSTLGFELTHDWSLSSQFQRAISLPPDNSKFYRIRRGSGSADFHQSADVFANDEVGDVSGGNPWTLTGLSALTAFSAPVTPNAFVVAANNLDMFTMSADIGDRAIYHDQMSIFGDAGSATPQGQALDVSSEFDTNLFCIIYSPAGSKFFVVGTDSGSVIIAQYNLSVPYDVNTAVYSGKQITVTPASTVQLGMFVWNNPGGGFRLVLTYPFNGASNGSAWRYDQYDAP